MTTQNIITNEIKKEIEEIYEHFPHKSAACIESLRVIQKHHRWVSDEAINELGRNSRNVTRCNRQRSHILQFNISKTSGKTCHFGMR